MMNSSNLFSKFKSAMYKRYGENPGTMLVHTGVLGWILSAMAQVSAVVFNDKISKEQKSFLIPQELADAGINILSFYLITSSFKKVASKLVSTGKISTAKIRNFIKTKVDNPEKYIGRFDSNIGKDFPEIKDDYKVFKNGIDVIASTAGSILSCNIVTPVLRNAVAAKLQKDALVKMHETDNNSNTQIGKPVTMNNYIRLSSIKYSSQSLKI